MRKLTLLLGVVMLLLISGCAPEPKLRVLWPAPPAQPRIEFLGVYASQYDFEKDRVGEFVDKVAGEGQAALFKGPYGIVADDKGKVYISDIFLRNIRIYNFNTKHVDFLFKSSPLARPLGLDRDSKGRLYIVDAELKKVLVHDPGEGQDFWLGGKEVLFERPSNLAINEKAGRIYVSDGGANNIKIFDLEGRFLSSFGGWGETEGKFFGPQGMAVDSQGRLFVCDQLNARIQVFNSDGEYLYEFGERGDQTFQFESPKDVDFDSEGNLYVVDGRRPHVFIYSPEGKLLLVAGASKATRHPLGFAAPRSVDVNANDRVYITDLLNKRFSVWQYLSEDYLQQNPITDEQKRALEEKLKKAEKTEKKQKSE